MGTECFTEQGSQVKQSAWNSRGSIKLKVKTAIIYWVPLCTEYWCLIHVIKLINSLHFSGTHQSKQWVDIIFQSSQYNSFTDEDKRLDSQPCQDSHQWTKDSDKGLPDSQTGAAMGLSRDSAASLCHFQKVTSSSGASPTLHHSPLSALLSEFPQRVNQSRTGKAPFTLWCVSTREPRLVLWWPLTCWKELKWSRRILPSPSLQKNSF